jgi:hypothetical protein
MVGSVESREIQYTLLVLVTGGAILLGLIGFNLVVDPYGMFRMVETPGINENRPAIYNRVRLMKAYDIRRIEPEVLVLGTSRTHLGISMNHPGWPGKTNRRYNAAFDGATTKEMYYYLRHAHSVRPLKQVLLGLDSYHPVAVTAQTRPDFSPDLLLAEESLSARLGLALQDLKLFASIQTLGEAWTTISAQGSAFAEWYAPDGQRLGEVFFRQPGESFTEFGPRHYFDEIDQLEVRFQLEWRIPEKVNRSSAALPVVHKIDPETSLGYIKKIVTFCRENKIDLRIFLTPSHVRQMEISAAAGGWHAIESGKRALVKLLAADHAAHPKQEPFPLWDFAEYSTVTTEPLPPPGSYREMAYYWDSSHFKSNVGDWVLDRVLGVARGKSPIPQGFGVRLTADNLDEVVDNLRQGHDKYRLTHRDDVETIRGWVDDFIQQNGINSQDVLTNRL